MKPILESGPLISACKYDVSGTMVIDFLTPWLTLQCHQRFIKKWWWQARVILMLLSPNNE